ncbi:MAG: hypothetical protein QOG83_364 [Alphaproteobacteria bacterium]|jgi:undecaprenyl-diphosphatase|nr:hypothetical protein [Alphaproteobacteria bacterium]
MSVTGGLKAAAQRRAAPRWRWISANVAAAFAAIARRPRTTARPAWRAVTGVVVAGTLVAVALAVAMAVIDGAVAEAAKHTPGWLRVAAATVTDFGKSGWFLWPSGLVLVAIAGLASPALPRVARSVLAALAVRVAFLFMAVAIPGLFSAVVKRLIGRARPSVGEHADPFLYGHFVWRPDYASLPSGHATTAFAAAIAIGLIWPRLRAVMLAYAAVIALSRVVLVTHYVSDVIAGAVVGTVGALLVRDWFAARRLGFVIDADGGVRALPGPSWARIKRVARRLLAP